MSLLPEPLSKDLQSLQTAIDQIVVAPIIGPASIDRIYALLHNSKVQGEELNFSLVRNLYSLACGILQRTRTRMKAPGVPLMRISTPSPSLSIIISQVTVGLLASVWLKS